MDGFEGLAAAILCAMIALVVIPAALGAVIGRALTKSNRLAGAVIGGVVGVLIGGVAIGFTFYEDVMRPPPHITFDVPPSFAHEWVFLVADPSVSREIVWEGSWSPEARVSVPTGGVVRVRDLGRIDGGHVNASLRSLPNVSFGACNAPGFAGGRVVMFGFAPWPGREPDLDCIVEGELEARLRELEAE